MTAHSPTPDYNTKDPLVHAQQDVTPTTADPTPASARTHTALADELNALLIRAAQLYRQANAAKAAEAAVKAEVVAALRRGATLPATHPRRPDRQIAQVNVSKATYKAATLNRAATEEWVTAKYPMKLENRERLVSTATEADVRNILRTFAPYLLETVKVVPDHVIRELELKSEQAHQPMGWGGETGDDAPPGIEVSVIDPKVTITFRDEDLLDELILSGVVDADGHIVGGAL